MIEKLLQDLAAEAHPDLAAFHEFREGNAAALARMGALGTHSEKLKTEAEAARVAMHNNPTPETVIAFGQAHQNCDNFNRGFYALQLCNPGRPEESAESADALRWALAVIADRLSAHVGKLEAAQTAFAKKNGLPDGGDLPAVTEIKNKLREFGEAIAVCENYQHGQTCEHPWRKFAAKIPS